MKQMILLGVWVLFLIISFSVYHARQPVQYMANAQERPAVKDVYGYNHALGRNMFFFSLLFGLITLPLFLSSHIAATIFLLLALPFWSIGFMLRCMQIETKYTQK